MQAFWAALAQFAYMVMMFGLLGRNLELLRKCFVVGSACAVAYSCFATEGTLWVPALWNGLFLFLNGAHLFYTRAERKRATLDSIEQFLKRTALAAFPPEQLKSFVRMGMEGAVKPGQVLVSSEAPEREIVCILKGSARVMENGKCLGEVKPGRLVGVLAYVCDYGGADVVAASEMKVIVWTGGAIDQWVGTDTSRLTLIQAAMGAQLVEQLIEEKEARRKLAAEVGGVAV